jgi:hypothetical protein
MKTRSLFCLFTLIFSVPAMGASYSRLEIRDWADFLFHAPDRPEDLDDPALSAVTREFGPAVIPLSKLPIESPLAVASSIPWSSWWFPKIDRDLFDDGIGTSPLEKYDFVRAALTGSPSKAAAFEKARYNEKGPLWEGLCDAWAIAATLFSEPRASRAITLPSGAKVSFSVGDQKALLLKTVDSISAEALKIYGQRFTGNSDGWIFPDLFPQELHRYVEKQLFERHELFVMDHDPGVEVWSEPVYKANYKITAVPGRSDAVFVRLWLYSATSFAQKEQKDKTGIRELAREYDYFLYGKQDGAGNLVVSSGVWAKGDLVDSRRDHPDFVYAVADRAAVKRNSQNPEIEATIVDQILGRP